jgi:RNA polymerase sigma factor (sigma-70 family)
MELYRHGEQRAFDVLYRRHSAKVYGYLARRLRDRDQCEDVLQGVFLKLHKSRELYNPSFVFVSWLFTICRTVMLDALKEKRVELVSMEMEEIDAKLTDRSSIDDSQAVDLSALPVNQRKVLELRYSENLSFEEIAEKLETSTVNVRKLASRGVKLLRSLLRGNGGRRE